MTEIYYIEDDVQIGEAVKEYLGRRGFPVSLFCTLEEAGKAIEKRPPELLLLDWNLPDGRGDGFCRRLRAEGKEFPVIFLTVRDDPSDMVSGFSDGADDYVVKPFELEVLHSRICAVLRRAGNSGDRLLRCGGICLDPSRNTVSQDGREVFLSPLEYELLRLLLENRGRTVTREQLLLRLWDQNGNFVNDNTLTVTMKRLREKLKNPSCIKTVRSFGYRMEEVE